MKNWARKNTNAGGEQMVKFRKTVKRTLSYNRGRYLSFLEERSNTDNWFGISLQLNNEALKSNQMIDMLDAAFKFIISEFDDASLWIVNYDGKDMPWLVGLGPGGANSITFSVCGNAGFGVETPVDASIGYGTSSTPVPIWKF